MITNKSNQIIKGPGGLVLELDARQIFPNDPGLGTPALLSLEGCTATFWCALNECEVEFISLTAAQQTWLDSLEDAVNSWHMAWTNRVRAENKL